MNSRMAMAASVPCISPAGSALRLADTLPKSSEPNVQKSSARPTVNPASPVRVTMKAFLPASAAARLRK